MAKVLSSLSAALAAESNCSISLIRLVQANTCIAKAWATSHFAGRHSLYFVPGPHAVDYCQRCIDPGFRPVFGSSDCWILSSSVLTKSVDDVPSASSIRISRPSASLLPY